MSHQIDLDGARAFVLAHSDDLAQARLAGVRPPKEVVKALEAVQRADGGFPRGWASPNGPAADAPSSLDATCFLLDQLRDLPPLTGSPMATRALSFLRRAQHQEGYWAEEGAPWLAGEAGTAYLTANVTFTLATLDPSNRDPVNWGLRWLADRLGEGPFIQTRYLTWAAAYRHEGPDSALAAKAWSALDLEQLGTDDLGWLLSAALYAGVGGRYLPAIARLLDRLASLQQADGGWPGEMDRTASTLLALRVLRSFGLE